VDKKEEFGNSVYKVAFTRGARDPPRIFGATYHFQLEEQVDVEEFLVFQPVFADICREYGLEGNSRILECSMFSGLMLELIHNYLS
jgi:hypothetical protein